MVLVACFDFIFVHKNLGVKYILCHAVKQHHVAIDLPQSNKIYLPCRCVLLHDALNRPLEVDILMSEQMCY